MANNTGQFSKVIVTATGKDMIAKSQGGQTLTFTRVALGDGLIPEGEDPVNYTSVKNERLSVPIAKFNNLGNGQFEIQFRITNQDVTTGFWHREIGVMAKIDNGAEALYAYTTAGNAGSYIYDKTTPVDERVVNVTFVVGNADNLEVMIDNSIIYITKKDFDAVMDEHEKNANAHSAAIDKHNTDASAHSDFKGASTSAAGKRGMVPAPGAGAATRYLRSDGTWAVPPDTDTKYGVVSTTANGLCPKRDGAANKVLVADGTWKDADTIDMTPVGDVVFRPFLKKDYVKANGATVNRSDYPRLVKFATDNNLWTSSPSTEPWKFGQGNGSTTMVLPNYIGRFIQGGDNMTIKNAGLPNITGRMYTGAAIGKAGEHQIGPNAYVNSALLPLEDSMPTESWSSEGTDGGNFQLNASLSNPIYGSSNTVQPPAITLIPQLRY